MRRTLAALVVVGALVAGAAACGDDDDAADDSSSESSSADEGAGGSRDADDSGSDDAPATGNGDVSTFCDGLGAVFADLSANEDVSEEQGRAAIDQLVDLDPPAEIAEDYATFVDFLEYMAANGEDAEEPEQELVDDWTAAAERLNVYAEEECGLTG